MCFCSSHRFFAMTKVEESHPEIGNPHFLSRITDYPFPDIPHTWPLTPILGHSITVCLSRQLRLEKKAASAVDVIEIHLLVHWASFFLGMSSKREKIWLHNMIYWKLNRFTLLCQQLKNIAQALWYSVTKTCLVLVLCMLASPPGCWALYMLDVRNVEPSDVMDTPQRSLVQREEAEK